MTRSAWLACCVLFSGCIIEGSTEPSCGDGVREGVEECDDGNLLSGDGCSATCDVEPFCGDGTVDPDEDCDDGNANNNDGCSTLCEIEPFCGDGTRDPNEACDDGDNDPSDGCSPTCQVEAEYRTTANWSFSTTQAPGVNTGCPIGYDTVAVYSQALSSTDMPLGAPIVDLFDCVDGTGITAPLYQGRYRTHIGVTNQGGTMTYATSTSAIVDLTTGNKTFTATIFTNGGYFSFAWDLVGETSNSPLTCAQVPDIDGISLVSTQVASPSTFFDDVFDCEDGSGLTAVLPAATYTVSVSAIDTADASLGTAPTLTNRTIQGPNKVTDLGTVSIPIEGL